jgi:hypothetical protein
MEPSAARHRAAFLWAEALRLCRLHGATLISDEPSPERIVPWDPEE